MGEPTVHFLMFVCVISYRSPSFSTSIDGSALIAPFTLGANASKKLSGTREHVVNACPTGLNKERSSDRAGCRFAAKEESFLHVFGVPGPGSDSRCLLRGVIQEQ